MAREIELERRRGELMRALPELSENQADTYRRNSDALALDRAGVKHERPDEMVRLGEVKVAPTRQFAMLNASFVASTQRSNSCRALVSGRDFDPPLTEQAPPGECFTQHAQSG